MIVVNGKEYDGEILGKYLERLSYSIEDYVNGEAIHSDWHVDDVLGCAEDNDLDITHDQAKSVLSTLDKNMDCEQGINWDVIVAEIEWLQNGRY